MSRIIFCFLMCSAILWYGFSIVDLGIMYFPLYIFFYWLHFVFVNRGKNICAQNSKFSRSSDFSVHVGFMGLIVSFISSCHLCLFNWIFLPLNKKVQIPSYFVLFYIHFHYFNINYLFLNHFNYCIWSTVHWRVLKFLLLFLNSVVEIVCGHFLFLQSFLSFCILIFFIISLKNIVRVYRRIWNHEWLITAFNFGIFTGLHPVQVKEILPLSFIFYLIFF